jgi:programmed cell death protein 5
MGAEEEEDAELAEIQRRRLLALQRRLTEQQKKLQIDAQKQAVLRVILTPQARQRLTNVKLVKPEFAEQLELQLIQSAQAGKVKQPITDEQLKEILIRLQSQKREIKIRRL